MKSYEAIISLNGIDTDNTRHRASTSTRWHFAFGVMLL